MAWRSIIGAAFGRGTHHPAKIMRKPEVLQANEDRGVLANRFAKSLNKSFSILIF